MSRLYSKTTGCLYIPGVHPVIPDDAVEISNATILEVIGNPVPGKVRSHDANGLPILIDPPLPSADELSADERQWRDGEIAASDALVARHRDEVEQGAKSTLSGEQYQELQAYRQLLRDWPEAEAFPNAEARPQAPDWLSGQL